MGFSTSRPVRAHSTQGRLGLIGLLAASTLALAGCATGAVPSSPTAEPTPHATTSPVGGLGDVARAAVERLGAAPCPPELAPALYVPSLEDGYLCGTLEVPLDHADPAGATLALEVLVHDSGLAGDESRGTVLYIGGGPGGVSRWMAALMPFSAPELAAQYDIVAMDLRGTGADALECAMLQDEVGASDIAVPSPEAVAECAASLGERALHQSTADAVADLALLREALELDRWVLNGTSYGTFVAQQFALRHPDSVQALVLDGPVPTGGVDPLLMSSMASIPRVLAELCEAQDCGFDPVAALESVLAAGYPALPLLNAIIGDSAMGATFSGLLEGLHDAQEGDTALLDAVVLHVEALSRAELAQFSSAAHIATLCSDTPMPWGDARTPIDERAGALAAAIDALDPDSTWPFPTSLAGEVGSVVSCLLWPAAAFDPPSTGPLPDVPTLVLSGGWDLSTPESNAAELAAANPGVRSVVIPAAGHAVQMGPDGLRAVTEFLLSLD